MPILESRLTHLMGIGGVVIRPGTNELKDEELKSVVSHKDGKFFVEDGKFVVPKTAPKAPKDK